MNTINKVAILIDGGFFVPCYKNNNGVFPKVNDIKPFISEIMEKVQSRTGQESHDSLFRIFYYDCRPFGEKKKDPEGNVVDFSKTPQFRAATAFHRDLLTYPQMALRLGDLSFDGWKFVKKSAGKTKYNPDFKQKSVDMKIGLDIAWMSSNHIVDKIVLVAGDSDFIAPMKFARKSGLLVYLETMGQKMIKLQLKEHADFVL